MLFALLTLHHLGLLIIGRVTLIFCKFRSISIVESLLLSYLAGTVVFSLVLFLLLLAQLHLTFTLVAGMHCIALLFAIIVCITKGVVFFFVGNTQRGLGKEIRTDMQRSKMTQFAMLLIVPLLLFRIAFVFWFTLFTPVYFDDVMGHWNIRGKNLMTEQVLSLDESDTSVSFLAGGRSHYPLLLPVAKAGQATFMGGWHEQLVNIIHPLMWLVLGMILFLRLFHRTKNTLLAMTFAFLMLEMPLMAFHASTAYSDLAVGGFFLLTFIFLEEYFVTREKSLLFLSGLFLFASMFTKNEGVVLFFIPFTVVLGVFALMKKDISLLVPSVIGFLLLLPHTILRIIFKLSLNPNEGEYLFHADAPVMLKRVLFDFGNFNILWYVLLFLVLGSISTIRRGKNGILGLILLLILLMTLFTYIFTRNFEFLANQQTVNRTFMLISFAFLYYFGVVLGERQYKILSSTQQKRG